MGLFSKILGDAAGKQLDDLVKQVADAAEKVASEVKDTAEKKDAPAASAPAPSAPAYTAPAAAAPSGVSWGEVMPAEENQFNFPGTPVQYFDQVFREAFPQYSIERSAKGKNVTFFFREGDRLALVVELLSQSSSVYKMRNDCRARRIPYLRYYYDHEGWWNTRSYVVERTRRALGC